MLKRRPLVVLLGLAVLLGWGAPAAAHAVLVSSSPAPGATVTSPATVSLTFDDVLLDIGARISVVDAQGVDHAAGPAYFPDPKTVQVDVVPLAPGPYAAEWRVVADDGHPIEGTLSFTVVAASPEPSLTGGATAAAPSSSGEGAVPSPQPDPTGADVATVPGATAAEPQGQVFLTIAVTLAAIALIAAAVFFLLPKDPATGSRRRRAPR